MKKKIMLVTVVGVVIAILGILWYSGFSVPSEHELSKSQTVKKDKKNSSKTRDASVVVEAERIENAPKVPVETLTREDMLNRYVGLKSSRGNISDKCIKWLQNNKCPYHDLYDRKTKTFVQGDFGEPLDRPRVEFRFRKRDSEENLVPHPVRAVLTYPVWDGRSHPPRDKELFQAMQIRSMADIEDDFAYAARFFLSGDPMEGEYDSLVFGQRYYMEFLYPDFRPNGETADHYGSALIRMPEHVDRGKMAVFTVDVTDRAEGWGRPGSYSKKKKQVKIRVGNMPSVPHVAASLYDPDHQMSLHDQVTHNGEAEIDVHELGGELVVIAYVAKEEGHLLYYKRSVSEREVELPEDADIVVDPDDVVSFDLKVPAGKEAEDAIGLGLFLFLRRDSKIAVAGAQVEKGNERPHSVKLMAPPGSYYVGGDSENPEFIGKITVKESDAGKTLEVEPLEE